MSNSIYQISKELELIFQAIEINDGEVNEETFTALAITQEQIQNKGIQYGFKCMEINRENDQIDSEIERLTAIKKRNANLEKRLKETLSNAMQHFGIDEIKISTLKINFRKSESVTIENEDLIDDKFKIEKVTKTISKTAIKEAIKSGIDVKGAKIDVNYNLQIK